MVNTLQILRYFALFDIFLSKFLFNFLSYLTFLCMQNAILSDWYFLNVDTQDLNHKNVSDYRFVSQGIDNSSILLSASDTFMTLMIITLQYLIIVGWSLIITPKSNKIYPKINQLQRNSTEVNSTKVEKKGKQIDVNNETGEEMQRKSGVIDIENHQTIQNRLKQSNEEGTNNRQSKKALSWLRIWNWVALKFESGRNNGLNLALRTGMELYVELLLSSLMDLKSITLKNSTDKNSTTTAFICLGVWVIFAMVILYVCLTGYEYLKKPRKYENKVGTLTEVLRLNRWSIWEHMAFIIRRSILAVVVVFGSKLNTVQLGVMVAWSIFIILFEIKVQPYIEKNLNIQNVITEFFLLAFILCLFTYLKEDTKLTTSGYASIIGYIWVAIVISIVLLHYVFHVINTIIRMRREKLKRSIKKGIQSMILNKIALKMLPLYPQSKMQNRVSERTYLVNEFLNSYLIIYNSKS